MKNKQSKKIEERQSKKNKYSIVGYLKKTRKEKQERTNTKKRKETLIKNKKNSKVST